MKSAHMSCIRTSNHKILFKGHRLLQFVDFSTWLTQIELTFHMQISSEKSVEAIILEVPHSLTSWSEPKFFKNKLSWTWLQDQLFSTPLLEWLIYQTMPWTCGKWYFQQLFLGNKFYRTCSHLQYFLQEQLQIRLINLPRHPASKNDNTEETIAQYKVCGSDLQVQHLL
jgi:hypothetical protein